MDRVTRRAGAALGLAAVLVLSACSGGGEGGGDPKRITVWTGDTLPDRVAATQAIITEFTAKTGIAVELVGVDEDQFNQTLTSAAAAGELPDVIGSQPLASVRTLAINDLVDTAATAAVVEALNAETFDQRALELTRDGDAQLAVPSDAWSQLLYYRRDLFDAAGLPAPTSYESVLNAARTLNRPGLAGFVGATAAGDAFTQQTFEQVALANGCQLVDQAGAITIASPPCVDAFAFYRDLIADYSVPGAQDVDSVRATYFAGQAAMAIWSTFLLDEMAGLRLDALPSCPECTGDPTFLAKNTGIVPALQGPEGTEPAQFGEVSSWAIPVESSAESAQQFVAVHAQRRLRAVAGHRARGQVSRPARGPRPGAPSTSTPGRPFRWASTPRLRWRRSTRPRCSRRCRPARTPSPGGGSRRARATSSEPPSGSSRCRPPSPRSPAAGSIRRRPRTRLPRR